jgi:hypothetical protein
MENLSVLSTSYLGKVSHLFLHQKGLIASNECEKEEKCTF